MNNNQEYQYEILCRYKNDEWEHCDYAKDKNDKDYLLNEYKIAYGRDFSFKVKKL